MPSKLQDKVYAWKTSFYIMLGLFIVAALLLLIFIILYYSYKSYYPSKYELLDQLPKSSLII